MNLMRSLLHVYLTFQKFASHPDTKYMDIKTQNHPPFDLLQFYDYGKKKKRVCG